MGKEFNLSTGDTLADAIVASYYYHQSRYAIILNEHMKRRESMRSSIADIDEECPLSEKEFNEWVNSHFNQ